MKGFSMQNFAPMEMGAGTCRQKVVNRDRFSQENQRLEKLLPEIVLRLQLHTRVEM